MKNRTLTLIVCLVVGLIAVISTLTLRWGSSTSSRQQVAEGGVADPGELRPLEAIKTLRITMVARKNLKLFADEARTQSYWQTIQIPGIIADRPGYSDRGVTSPAVGVVTAIHAFEGDTVAPGDRLFTLRLFSEYLQNTQAELFRATRESELISEQRQRLENAVRGGAISEAKLIELDNDIRRQAALMTGFRQDLLTRGLLPEQIDQIARGQFVSSIDLFAPSVQLWPVAVQLSDPPTDSSAEFSNDRYEVQKLQVDIGQQVQAGQLLSTLSNHHQLYIEGHAFKREASLLSQVAERGIPLTVEFTDDDQSVWKEYVEPLKIRHLANSIDPESRTFSFYVPLTNQSRSYEKDGQTFTLWRFRPGQRVRLSIPVQEMRDVFVLPTKAVVREGPETFVFQQRGEIFTRISVHVLYEDREHVVIENDGRIEPGVYLAQNSAAALLRILKSQSAGGKQSNVHVHADGTVHEAH